MENHVCPSCYTTNVSPQDEEKQRGGLWHAGYVIINFILGHLSINDRKGQLRASADPNDVELFPLMMVVVALVAML